MAFRSWGRQSQESASPPDPAAAEPQGHACETLRRALDRALRGGRAELLYLGPLCGQSVVHLASRGAKVHVDEFVPPEPIPPKKPGEPEPRIEPFRLDHDDGTFDLVLVWESLDFVPPERLAEVGSELRRVLRVGGLALVLSHSRPEGDRQSPPRYRIVADDRVAREESGFPEGPRWVHPNREIERALSGLSIETMHLQRTQLREILAVAV